MSHEWKPGSPSSAGLRGTYPLSSDASELKRAMFELARAHENTVRTHQTHWSEIRRLEDVTTRLAQAIETMTRELIETRAKMAVYTGIGAAVSGGLISMVVWTFTR